VTIKRYIVLVSLLASQFLTAPRPEAQATKAMLLFGGEGHKTFLGCLNCLATGQTSVCNDVGKYGSDLSEDSIRNDLGPYGSDLSQTSPWNSLSQDAPIIVDRAGRSYGYFSTNSLHHDRTRIDWLVAILDYYDETNDLSKTREKMCGN
jgi:hypothetical protein